MRNKFNFAYKFLIKDSDEKGVILMGYYRDDEIESSVLFDI